MKKKKMIIILIAIALVLIIGIAIYVCYGKAQKDGNFLVAKESFDIGQVTKLKLDGCAADINLKFIDSGECTIEEYANVSLADDEKFEAKVDGSEFEISNPIETSKDVSGLKNLSINICLPKDIIKEYSLILDIGNLSIESQSKNSTLSCDKFKVYADVGDVTIGTNLNANNIDITDSIGNITTKDLEGSLVNIKNGTGNVVIDSLVFTTSSKVETDIGDVSVGIANDCYIDAKTNTGTVNIDKTIKNKSSKNTLALILNSDIGNINVTDRR